MGVVQIASETPNPYPKLFETYIVARVAYLLSRVRDEGFVHSVGDQEKFLHALRYALRQPDAWPGTRQLLLAAVPPMEKAGYRDEWIHYLKQGIARSQQVDDLETAAELQYQVGVLERRRSEFSTAHHWLTASVHSFASLQDTSGEDTSGEHRSGQARALSQLAYLAYLQHDYETASTLTQRALELLPPDHPVRAMSYVVRGMIEIDHRRWQQAERWHRQAFQIRTARGDQRGIAWSLLDLAHALCGQNRYTEAIANYQQAVALLETLGDVYHWSHAQMNLGRAYFHTGALDEALACFARAEAEWTQHRDTLNLAKLYTNYGLTYLAQERLADAERAFRRSVRLYGQLADHPGRLNATDGLAMALLAQHTFGLATEILEQALVDLAQIAGTPTHEYLLQSMTRHLQEAQRGLAGRDGADVDASSEPEITN